MKRTFLCLLAVLAVTAAGAAAAPLDTEITAPGFGAVSLPPDVATVAAGIDTNAASATDALAESNRRYDGIVAALLKLGVSRGDIALSYYNVAYNPPPQTMPPNPNGERYGYIVSRSFSVKVRDIRKAGIVTDACIDAGATSINGVQFGLADPAAARAQAITAAVASARKNAEVLARSSALHIVRIERIELQNGSYAPAGPLMAQAAARSTAFDQSNVMVEAWVTVVFVASP